MMVMMTGTTMMMMTGTETMMMMMMMTKMMMMKILMMMMMMMMTILMMMKMMMTILMMMTMMMTMNNYYVITSTKLLTHISSLCSTQYNSNKFILTITNHSLTHTISSILRWTKYIIFVSL